MRLFGKIKDSLISGLKFYFFMLVSICLFQSCNFSDKEQYNEGYKAGYEAGLNAAKSKQHPATSNEDVAPTADPNYPSERNQENDEKVASNPGVPQKAILILDYIRKNNKAPDGYVGGRHFGNYEHNLPARDAAGNAINYQEWDINKKVEGQNRGAQRLITGSDGRAWYTADHYSTFTEIK